VSLLRAAASWLVEPAAEPGVPAAGLRAVPAREAAGEPAPLRVAVLGSGRSAPALAAAVALSCRAAARTPAALVAVWRSPGVDVAPPGPAAPPLPGAGSVAARLARRDLPVAARGRLIWLSLPGDCTAAVPILRHAEAAAGDVPVVLAVARPREPAVDAVLAGCELALVAAEPGTPLAAATLEDAADLGVSVVACAPLAPGVSRAAALAGLHAPPLALEPLPW
jgi:hypothetical protein